MKRFLSVLLVFALLLSAFPFSVGAVTTPRDGEFLAGGLYLTQLVSEYSCAFRLFSYSLRGAKSVRFGKSSAFSQKLAASEQLLAIAASGAEGSGDVSFYDGSDLEYAVGEASYTLSYRRTEHGSEAVFVISDRYDFDSLRGSDSFSELLNDLGYLLQNSGNLHIYDWSAEVVIPLDPV